MPRHGGKRKGAGRKPGIQNKINQNIREKILARGPSPLEILADMYLAPQPVREEGESALIYAKRLELWSAEKRFGADKASPFLHHKLQAIEVSGTDGEAIKHQHKVEIEFVEAVRKK